MADINKIAEELGTLTILEAADLVKLLEEKWGVSAVFLLLRFLVFTSRVTD